MRIHFLRSHLSEVSQQVERKSSCLASNMFVISVKRRMFSSLIHCLYITPKLFKYIHNIAICLQTKLLKIINPVNYLNNNRFQKWVEIQMQTKGPCQSTI